MLRNSLCFFSMLLFLNSCGLFTFSGLVLPPDIKTFSIQKFYTEISDGPIDMAQKLTEALETKILRMTSLTKIEEDGDLQYEGILKSFLYRTVFNDKSDGGDHIDKIVQRLTITVEVTYLNPLDEEISFKNKTFSASADIFSPESTSVTEEARLVDEIFCKLVDAICNSSIDTW